MSSAQEDEYGPPKVGEWDEAEAQRVYAEIKLRNQASAPPPPLPEPPAPFQARARSETFAEPRDSLELYLREQAPQLHTQLQPFLKDACLKCEEVKRSVKRSRGDALAASVLEDHLNLVMRDMATCMMRAAAFSEFVKRAQRAPPGENLHRLAEASLRPPAALPTAPPFVRQGPPKVYAFLQAKVPSQP